MQTPYRKPGKTAHLPQDTHITEARAFEIKEKLKSLKKTIPKLAAEVALLAEGGDFSENAGYQAAKGRLRAVHQKILTCESQLRWAIIFKPQKQTDAVCVGHKVTVADGQKQKTYLILGSMETDPQKGIISQNSPLGIKLIGRCVGDVIKLKLKDKETEYTIVKIE